MTTTASVAVSDLGARLEEGARKARSLGRRIIVSVIAPFPGVSPLDAFATAGSACRRRWYWSSPEEGIELAGIGAACEITASGKARFDEVRRQWERLVKDRIEFSDLDSHGEASRRLVAGPQVFGGFSFRPSREGENGAATVATPWEGFPDACFILPELMVGSKAGHTWITVNRVVDPATDLDGLAEEIEQDIRRLCDGAGGDAGPPLPPGALMVVDSDFKAWERSVRTLVDAIKSGRFDKAVLARSVRVEAPRPFDAARVLRALAADYPMCYRFAIQLGERCFLGSTPELLVAKDGHAVRSMALAGSAPRGATLAEDARIGASFLADRKNLEEHGVVVAAVRAALRPLCSELATPERPGVFKLPNVQHLFTPFSGTLKAGCSVIEISSRLHPTPAVGGHPVGPALESIAACEEIDRGWYAGPIGVVDARGDGAFAVAIRSALLLQHRAHLFAGCGIVAGSDPALEFQESRLKLVPILASLERSWEW